MNKTGTTSVEHVLKEFGYALGDQAQGELLIDDYKKNDWKSIIRFCQNAEAFQDLPFSLPYTWLFLYDAFPDAKFILTIRDEEKWYQSICSFHSKLFSDGIQVPTKEDLQKATYRYKGFTWKSHRAVWKTPENDPYNKKILAAIYNRHNEDVLYFFKDKLNFLCIDVSEKGSYSQLADFLNKQPLHAVFPHLNKTNND